MASLYDVIESLRADVDGLTRHGERVVGGKGHRAARTMLVERARALGLEPYHGRYEWEYRGGAQRFCNILARRPGRSKALPPVLLAAHYDTCGRQPGADDNAAAIAILLQVAARLRTRAPARDVIFAFFDAEEPPHFLSPQMGSTYFYRAQREEEVHCALVLDLCGHDVAIPGCEDLLFVTGMESDPALPPIVLSADETPGLRTVAVLTRYVGDLSDYHAFRLDQRPYLFLTCARWEHYHAPTDTPDKLNFEKMAAIVDYVETVARATCETALDGPFEGRETAETEAELIRRNMGPVLRALRTGARSREDIDRLIPMAISMFGV